MRDLTYTVEDLATLLNKAGSTVRSSHHAWHRQHGFPSPLPGMGLLWSSHQVDCWIATNGFSSPVEPTNTSSQIADAGHHLDATYLRASHAQ